ncbi:LD-carboxypeptidase [Brevibacillus ruminantium]|uniref:LD-carboxypeptidase n=1 Tax=Brevibacillus ruminantium TaxID=2950604 RepID=A0ABY4WJD7_9BACL|nr:S66 peptidase family protein [Brevibacillus ruminantium]USG67258.1 LD-carboxypeptidase [Brevibacillus ruminantium]
MRPQKLQPGDEVRIIAPSKSMALLSEEVRERAQKRLESMGLKVTFGKHVEECDAFTSSSVEARLEDLHQAFADPAVKGILTVLGGHNCNQLLRGIDYELIRRNPKILCGYSDITALSNAIYAKTGLIGYSGPHFSTFGMKKGMEYTLSYFQQSLIGPGADVNVDGKSAEGVFAEGESGVKATPIEVTPSEHWSDDEWYLDQDNRRFITSEGYLTIQEGEAEGTIIGGNLCTLNLLQGTEYMPSLRDAILFIEDDLESSPQTFDRDLQSLIHQPDFSGVKGVVIGRFQEASRMTDEKLIKIIRTKPELQGLPVIAHLHFGHTSPLFTFPIGGRAMIRARGGEVSLWIE